ncbi:tyrosine-protein phosphatase [Actinomycetospora cinnamomea]|uniref:Protein tyrosine/serine phosphatase n=1 Tax=Actinomycetospora cinnamomea TaxID=663609 RepID=A0A2U1FL22_9PSEU|nr:tyrosine-protein phosphatase [Actinomycetospora cinnamomea]PVZ12867.1 protein tyrosine/serine phosphatase [Actinomycetospora cinnamomea]
MPVTPLPTEGIEIEAVRHLANLRDVGGMPTVDGGRTRPGVLWRSDAPLHGDATTRGPGGLDWPPRTVVDLRNPEELDGRPHPLVDLGADLLPLPLIQALAPGVLMRGAPPERRQRKGLDELYLLLVRTGEAWMPPLVRAAAHGPGPLLVHCAAGKDRTGVAVALLLRAAGVPRDAVAADFAVTNAHRAPLRDRLAAQGALDPDTDPSRVGVDPEHLEAVLDLLDDDPRTPLREAGVPEPDLDAWRARLVDAA